MPASNVRPGNRYRMQRTYMYWPVALVPSIKLSTVVLLVLPLMACSGHLRPSTEVSATGETSLALDNVADQTVARNKIFRDMSEGLSGYRIAPGDVLEALYLSSNVPQPTTYTMGVGDKLRIEFHYTDEPPRTVVVRPDGMITVPFKGDIMTAGVTPMELGKKLESVYRDVFSKPRITVTVEEFTSKLDDLRVSLESLQRGRSQKIVMSPEGVAYLPYLNGIQVAGLGIDAAREHINEQYRNKYGNLEVSLLLDTVTGNRIFVFGEVANPGIVLPTRQPTVLQAIASAGGHLPTGSLSEVKVLYWSAVDNQPRLRTVNLQRVIDEQRVEEDMVLPGNSTVYVPPTGITKANRFIDQYLKQLFLFNGTSIGINYQLNDDVFGQ
jgi:polysaccharide export outer membrane protein